MDLLIPLDNTGGGGIARVGTELIRALSSHLTTEDRLIVLGGEGPSRPGGRLRQTLGDQLRVIAPARHADLVHSVDAKAPLLSGTPFSLTVHDLFFHDHPEWYPRSVAVYKRALLAASLARRPRLIVCVSEHTRERLLANHPAAARRSRVVVISSGIPATPAAPRGDPVSGEYFLTVSAIEPRKNHLGLLTAFRQARRDGLTLRWKVVGRPQYDAAGIMSELEDADGVELLGRVGDDDLERLYAGARFVVTPSWEEGFGLPPLEAMRRGIPAICSTGSALDETVADAGLRIDPGDSAGWARALRQLQDDELMISRLREVGRAHAERFSWNAAAAAYMREFRLAVAA
jgi:glycosyltransferase involved in cell wall biosynthesis